jgi:hypothetical protein
MRKIREVLRLALGEELSRRQVAAASGVPLTTVNDYLRRAAAADRAGVVRCHWSVVLAVGWCGCCPPPAGSDVI